MPYPPRIRANDFVAPEPPPRDVRLPCMTNPCAIARLGLTPHGQQGWFTTGDEAHEDLVEDAAGRYRIAPGREPNLVITWTFEGHAHIDGAALELFCHSVDPVAPLWSRFIEFAAGGRAALGRTPFGGRITQGSGVAVGQGTVNDVRDDGQMGPFPSGYLNVAKSPYKLRMTIFPANDAYADVYQAWIYIDVLIAAIRPAIGAPLPAGATLSQAFPVNNEVAQVRLRSNLFSDDNAQWANRDDDFQFNRLRVLWGRGPEIPCLAVPLVTDSSGTAVVAPEATQGLRLMWEWADAKVDEANLDGAAEITRTAAYVNRYLQHQMGAAPGRNCHVDHGGKRGSAAPEDRVLPAGAGRTAGITRVKALFSVVNAEGAAPAVFQPSRIAGDAYRLSVHWSPGDIVALLDRADPPAAAISVVGGKFEVWRSLDVVRLMAMPEVQGDPEAEARAAYVLEERAAIAREEARIVTQYGDDWADYDERTRDDVGGRPWQALKVRRARLQGFVVAVAQPQAPPVPALPADLRTIYRCAYIHLNDISDAGPRIIADLPGKIRAQVAAMNAVVQAAVRFDGADWLNQRCAVHYRSFAAFRDELTRLGVNNYEDYFVTGRGVDEGQKTFRADAGFVAAAFKGVYEASHIGWTERILQAIVRGRRSDADGINIFTFQYNQNWISDGVDLGLARLGGKAVLYGGAAANTTFLGFGVDALDMGHEIGHCMYLSHAPGHALGAEDAAGTREEFHDATNSRCLMGYSPEKRRFCGLCLLRLRGYRWSVLHADGPR